MHAIFKLNRITPIAMKTKVKVLISLILLAVLLVLIYYLLQKSTSSQEIYAAGVFDPMNNNIYFAGSAGYIIINGATGHILEHVTVNLNTTIGSMAIDPSGKYLYFYGSEVHYKYDTSTLYTIGAQNNTLVSRNTICGDCGGTLFINPYSKYLYVPAAGICEENPFANATNVELWDPKTNSFAGDLNLTYSMSEVAYNAKANTLYAIAPSPNCMPDFVVTVNASSNKIISYIPINRSFGILFDSSNGNLYVRKFDTFEILVINTTANRNITNIAINGGGAENPGNISISDDYMILNPTNNHIYATYYSGIAIINASTNQVVGNIKVGRPAATVYDPLNNKLYISTVGGTLTVVNAS